MLYDSYCIEFQNVVQRFRLIRERPDTLREVFSKIVRRRQQLQIFEAVKQVSFLISKREAVGLVGPDGSGKNKILKIFAGGERPSGGQVKVQRAKTALLVLGPGVYY